MSRQTPFLCTASLLAFFLFHTASFAQRPADWSVDLPGKPQQILFQNLSGMPIVQTDKAYIGINPDSKKIAWTVERKAQKLVERALNMDIPEFINIAGSPFVVIGNNLIDSRNGAVLLDKDKNDYKYFGDYELIPALNSVLVRVVGPKNMVRIYLVEMTQGHVKWGVDVTKPAIVTGINEDDPEEPRADMPLYTSLVGPEGHLVYQYQKTLAVVSPEGKLLWSEKADPAEIMLSPDGKKVIVVKALSTGIANSPVKVRYQTKYRSSKISAFDLKTGKEAWKDDIKADQNIRWTAAYPDFLAVAWKNGCNIYKYSSGEAIWEKDFKGKWTVDLETNDQGYLVHFDSGYKTMQLDKKGQERWDKPRVQESDDDEEIGDEVEPDVYTYAKGKILVDPKRVRFRPAKGSGLKKWKTNINYGCLVAFDDSLRNLIILDNETLYILNPDQNPQVVTKYKDNFQDLPNFHTVEFRANGYFMSSAEEFILLDPVSGKLTHRYYQRPFDPEGFFMDMFRAELSLQSSLLQHRAGINFRSGSRNLNVASASFMPPGFGIPEFRKARRQQAASEGLSFAAAAIPPARKEAFTLTPNFAWYLVREKGQNTLVKVHKDTGAETDRLAFDDARPLYEVDEVQQRVYYASKNTLKTFEMLNEQ